MLARANIPSALVILCIALASWIIGYAMQGDESTADYWFLFDAIAKFSLSAFSVLIINHYWIRTVSIAFVFMAASNLADEVLPYCSPTETGLNEYLTAALVIAFVAYRFGFHSGMKRKNYARSS